MPLLKKNPIWRYTTNVNQLQILQWCKKYKAVVDAVTSPTKLEIHIPTEHTQCRFTLTGISEIAAKRSKALSYATNWTVERLLQRNVEIAIINVKGNILFGHLFLNKKDFALDLLQKGLVKITALHLVHKSLVQEYSIAETLSTVYKKRQKKEVVNGNKIEN